MLAEHTMALLPFRGHMIIRSIRVHLQSVVGKRSTADLMKYKKNKKLDNSEGSSTSTDQTLTEMTEKANVPASVAGGLQAKPGTGAPMACCLPPPPRTQVYLWRW